MWWTSSDIHQVLCAHFRYREACCAMVHIEKSPASNISNHNHYNHKHNLLPSLSPTPSPSRSSRSSPSSPSSSSSCSWWWWWWWRWWWRWWWWWWRRWWWWWWWWWSWTISHQPSAINHQSSSSISLADTKNVTIISKKSFLFGSRSTVTAACNATTCDWKPPQDGTMHDDAKSAVPGCIALHRGCRNIANQIAWSNGHLRRCRACFWVN